jgi:hypothetical protein
MDHAIVLHVRVMHDAMGTQPAPGVMVHATYKYVIRATLRVMHITQDAPFMGIVVKMVVKATQLVHVMDHVIHIHHAMHVIHHVMHKYVIHAMAHAMHIHHAPHVMVDAMGTHVPHVILHAMFILDVHVIPHAMGMWGAPHVMQYAMGRHVVVMRHAILRAAIAMLPVTIIQRVHVIPRVLVIQHVIVMPYAMLRHVHVMLPYIHVDAIPHAIRRDVVVT